MPLLRPNPFDPDAPSDTVEGKVRLAFQHCLDLETQSMPNTTKPKPLIGARVLGHLLHIVFHEGDKENALNIIAEEIVSAAAQPGDMIILAHHYVQYLIKPCKVPSHQSILKSYVNPPSQTVQRKNATAIYTS